MWDATITEVLAGRVPPTEAEAHYYSEHVTDQPAGSQNPQGCMKLGMVQKPHDFCPQGAQMHSTPF